MSMIVVEVENVPGAAYACPTTNAVTPPQRPSGEIRARLGMPASSKLWTVRSRASSTSTAICVPSRSRHSPRCAPTAIRAQAGPASTGVPGLPPSSAATAMRPYMLACERSTTRNAANGLPELRISPAFGASAATARSAAARSLRAPTTASAPAVTAAATHTTASAANAIARLRIGDSQAPHGERQGEDESGGEERDRGLEPEPGPERAECDRGHQLHHAGPRAHERKAAAAQLLRQELAGHGHQDAVGGRVVGAEQREHADQRDGAGRRQQEDTVGGEQEQVAADQHAPAADAVREPPERRREDHEQHRRAGRQQREERVAEVDLVLEREVDEAVADGCQPQPGAGDRQRAELAPAQQ